MTSEAGKKNSSVSFEGKSVKQILKEFDNLELIIVEHKGDNKYVITLGGDLKKDKQSKYDKIIERLDKIDNRLDTIDNRLDNVENRLDTIEQDISAIKKCPTVKKELGE